MWVITGRRTFSAATMTALHMRQQTEARLVGEPSRGNPNGTYNMETLRLSRSRIEVDYTNRLHEPAPELLGLDAVPLYAHVPVDFVSYRAGRDPVLEWILTQGKADASGWP